MSRFNEVGKESDCDRGDPQTDGAGNLAVHGSINGRSGEHDSKGVEFHVPFLSLAYRFLVAPADMNSMAPT